MARTAVVAGTATAVSNRVSRRQANRWSEQEQYDQYQQQQQYAPPPQQYAQPAPAPAPQYAPAQPEEDRYAQLTKLGELRQAGILSDAEFEAEKARILRS